MTLRRGRRATLAALLLAGVASCDKPVAPSATLIEGEPGGPYRMTLSLAPPQPEPGKETRLTWQLTHNGAPVADLQVLHERVIHNFIVNLDFSSFAHIHHEDFRALTADDLKRATFTLPYRFPRAGHYRVVSDFTHRNRSWTEHFDVTVGTPDETPAAPPDLTRTREQEGYQATLNVSPPQPVAGFETELVMHLLRGGAAVNDLALILGAEVHVALWREDGRDFGHTHSYTPHMAKMMNAMYDQTVDAETRARRLADMMVMMMNMPSELVYHGPDIPVHYVFPEPGVYHLFLQCAPAGRPRVFHFALAVVAFRDGMDTHLESIVAPQVSAP